LPSLDWLAASREPEAAAGALVDGVAEVDDDVEGLEDVEALAAGAAAGGVLLEPQALSPTTAAASEATARVERRVLMDGSFDGGWVHGSAFGTT